MVKKLSVLAVFTLFVLSFCISAYAAADDKFELVIFIDNTPTVIWVAPEARLGNVVVDIKNTTGNSYSHSYELSMPVTPDSKLSFYTFGQEELVEIKPIEYDTEIILTDKLMVGETEVQTEGETGFTEFTYTVFTKYNKETSRTLEKSDIIKQPVNRVELHGVAPLGSKPPKEYLKKVTMEATAYSLDYKSTKKYPGDPAFGLTYSGIPAAYGIVAVDPKVIPLGTKLYVEGYGEAMAWDIGSAIKGYKIDLFYDTMEEAIIYGRKKIEVYILEYPEED